MRRYETVFIARPDLPDDVIDELLERLCEIITDMKGIVVAVEKWGKRKLAYPISKERKGYYILMDFVGDSAVVTELEKKMKFNDNVLKYLSTKKSERVDLKEIEKEMAAAGQDKSPEDTIPTETVSASEIDKTDVTDSGKPPMNPQQKRSVKNRKWHMTKGVPQIDPGRQGEAFTERRFAGFAVIQI